MTQQCRACGQDRPIDEFTYRDKINRPRYVYTCTACRTAGKYRFRNKESSNRSEKKCTRCKEIKPFDDFRSESGRATKHICAACWPAVAVQMTRTLKLIYSRRGRIQAAEEPKEGEAWHDRVRPYIPFSNSRRVHVEFPEHLLSAEYCPCL